MTEPDDEIRFIVNAHRWIDGDVGIRLWERGWAAMTDPDDSNNIFPAEWFWPPTAPVEYDELVA